MLLTLALLAATVAATPTPVPVPATPRTLSDIARERKGKPVPRGSISQATGTAAGVPSLSTSLDVLNGVITAAPPVSPYATSAQDRMERAVIDFQWTARHIKYNGEIRHAATQEWDAAAESCRQTDGCVPKYRPAGVSLP